ncbi:glycosyltransferase, partial [Patescibacteria group bacterium]|nr:glycosyltransferase [Patescibacteria group bacterium]
MKASLIITTLNEAETIKPLLESIANQTLIPDEVIIIDAGSNDGTRAIIKKFSQVKLINQPGLNRSQARNLGIKLAKNKIIAVTDAG